VRHDRLFKELLGVFLGEFLELFAPELAREIEPGSLDLKPTELPRDLTEGTGYDVDVLAQARLRGAGPEPGAYVLVHVETQDYSQRDFARRMFRYFSAIGLKHELPIYPIALFSFERPQRRQAARYDIRLPGLHVLGFRFRTVQLNRLDWRAFLKLPNPVAAALMARMRIPRAERVRVKAACVRALGALNLDRARLHLASGFVDVYLRLSEEEQKLFEAELQQLPEGEREKVMEIITSWMEEGLEKGREEGRRLVLRQLTRRLGELPEVVADRVRSLSPADLEVLAESLLDFQTAGDLERWLEEHAPA
jgi:hypothetical protein